MALHVRTLRAVLGWAYEQRLIACQPLDGMRGLPQPEPRRDVPLPVVVTLLRAAANEVDQAAQHPAGVGRDRLLHDAEQVQLLIRLAADTGARRGELAALRVGRPRRPPAPHRAGDLRRGRQHHQDRPVAHPHRRHRHGAGLAAHPRWLVWSRRRAEGLGPWLFSRRPDHTTRMPCNVLADLFRAFARRHGHGDVTLHRLRHTVATVLVADGHLLQAQQRLGHEDASTTLRQYCHALPLHDQDVADHLDALLQQRA